jgi:hypothetical protein
VRTQAVRASSAPRIDRHPTQRAMVTGLLACGALSSLLYVAMNVVAPLLYDGYSVTAQAVSELSAIGAPTRPLWLALAVVYALLVVAFGFGLRSSAGRDRHLRIAGTVLIAYAVFGVFWPPMHQRGVETSLTDLGHIVWTAITVPLMLVVIGYAAAALGRRFRIYSMFSVAIILGFGALTGMSGGRIPKDLPTPWLGVWERIGIAGFMLWVVVLAIALLRRDRGPRPETAREAESGEGGATQ